MSESSMRSGGSERTHLVGIRDVHCRTAQQDRRQAERGRPDRRARRRRHIRLAVGHQGAGGRAPHVRRPDQRDETGEVALESRSRRGVGKATISFDSKQSGYAASGGGGIEFSGTVADVSVPCTLPAAGSGFTVEFSFSPSDARSGSLTYSGSGGGATMSGTGSYTISGEEPGPLQLAFSDDGCVVGGGCAGRTGTITLTPIGG